MSTNCGITLYMFPYNLTYIYVCVSSQGRSYKIIGHARLVESTFFKVRPLEFRFIAPKKGKPRWFFFNFQKNKQNTLVPILLPKIFVIFRKNERMAKANFGKNFWDFLSPTESQFHHNFLGNVPTVTSLTSTLVIIAYFHLGRWEGNQCDFGNFLKIITLSPYIFPKIFGYFSKKIIMEDTYDFAGKIRKNYRGTSLCFVWRWDQGARKKFFWLDVCYSVL